MPSGFHTWSQTAADNASADSSINWAEGQAPSSVNDSARSEMASLAKWRDDNNGSLTTGGTSTAYTLTTNTVFTSLALMDNATLAFTMDKTSGATPTLNVDGLGAKAIRNVTGVALPTGALLAGAVYRATYDNGAGEWLIHNQAGILPTSSVATASIADDAVTFAKLQNATGAVLIGKSDSGSGNFEEITLGAGLAFSGDTLVGSTNQNEVYGYLSGLTLSTAGSSGTMSIAIGGANDVAAGGFMALTSAISKTTSSWAVGSGNGGLDTGAIATNTWYHFFLIKRVDTGVVDVLFSTSATAPTMPTNYTLKRRIGSGRTNGSSQWTKFTQTGDTFIWETAVADASGVGLGSASRSNITLTVPTGVVVCALFRAGLSSVTGSVACIISSLQEEDVAAGTANSDLSSVSGGLANGSFARLTNTSAEIARRGSALNAVLSISTYGWIDTRGK